MKTPTEAPKTTELAEACWNHGPCNLYALIGSLAECRTEIGVAELRNHPAIKIILGQLSYLAGESLGPSDEAIQAYKAWKNTSAPQTHDTAANTTAPKPPQPTTESEYNTPEKLQQARRKLADQTFENYNFPTEVAESDGWESVIGPENSNNRPYFKRDVYCETSPDQPSKLIHFAIYFEPNSTTIASIECE